MSAMFLKGFRKTRSKRYGGISAVRLVYIGDVMSVGYDPEGRECTGIELNPGASFAVYDFREGAAAYVETCTVAGGVCRTVHELSFSMPRMDPSSAGAAAGLGSASGEGMLAIVTTACGDDLLVGHTPQLGGDYPLRMISGAGNTGEAPADDPCYTVRLRCESASHASPYKGVIP